MIKRLMDIPQACPGLRTIARLSILLPLVFAGCDRSGSPKAPDRPIPADEVTDFVTLYSQNCAGCHGADGMLGPGPPLNDPLFLDIVPDQTLLKLVTEGRPGTPMPGFSRKKGGSLTDEQVKALATGLKPHWKTTKTVAPNLPDYIATQNGTATNPNRGRDVFARACAGCHGPDGEGTDKAGKIHDPAFLALISDQTLRRYVITGRPDLGMPSYREKTQRAADFQPLSSQEISDLVAFVSDWRKRDPAPSMVQKPAVSGTQANSTTAALPRRLP
jgi:mono/diheme cytochrome c family protein